MKKAKVVWSNEALVDLETIYDFLAEKSPTAAQKIAYDILSRAKQLESHPESGQALPDPPNSSTKYRYLVEGNYKIIYRVDKYAVYINTVFDTRMNPDSLKLEW